MEYLSTAFCNKTCSRIWLKWFKKYTSVQGVRNVLITYITDAFQLATGYQHYTCKLLILHAMANTDNLFFLFDISAGDDGVTETVHGHVASKGNSMCLSTYTALRNQMRLNAQREMNMSSFSDLTHHWMPVMILKPCSNFFKVLL